MKQLQELQHKNDLLQQDLEIMEVRLDLAQDNYKTLNLVKTNMETDYKAVLSHLNRYHPDILETILRGVLTNPRACPIDVLSLEISERSLCKHKARTEAYKTLQDGL